MANESSTQQWYTLRNVGNKPELLIYGYIGPYDDVDFIGLQSQISNLSNKHKELTVRIHSGGGSVIDGLPIFDSLHNSGMEITTIIDGMAASMASVLSQVGTIRKMQSNGMIMIHRVKGTGFGTSDDIRAYADLVDDRETRIKQIFSEKTGQSTETVNEWFSKNTDWWINATTALELGLIDEIIESDKKPATINNTFKNLNESKAYELLKNSITDLPQEFVQVDNLANIKNELHDVKQSRASLLIANALKEGRIKDERVEYFMNLAINNYEVAETVIAELPEKPRFLNINVGLSSGNDPKASLENKENWTLDDYRKNAPDELENNPDLYKELINKKFKQ
ncbi:head maturation protease, ClpP-related [Sphingobacterium spiritivorum]|uniref:head maturation protease, ClpP-related n=1 Tax=Sphingobacterium spiritivorum TaxID=258 RepID=UPI003DA2359A